MDNPFGDTPWDDPLQNSGNPFEQPYQPVTFSQSPPDNQSSMQPPANFQPQPPGGFRQLYNDMFSVPKDENALQAGMRGLNLGMAAMGGKPRGPINRTMRYTGIAHAESNNIDIPTVETNPQPRREYAFDKDKLKEMWGRGDALGDIANEFQSSPRSISAIISALRKQSPAMWPIRGTQAGRTVQTEEFAKNAAALIMKGHSDEEIARLLGYSTTNSAQVNLSRLRKDYPEVFARVPKGGWSRIRMLKGLPEEKNFGGRVKYDDGGDVPDDNFMPGWSNDQTQRWWNQATGPEFAPSVIPQEQNNQPSNVSPQQSSWVDPNQNIGNPFAANNPQPAPQNVASQPQSPQPIAGQPQASSWVPGSQGLQQSGGLNEQATLNMVGYLKSNLGKTPADQDLHAALDEVSRQVKTGQAYTNWPYCAGILYAAAQKAGVSPDFLSGIKSPLLASSWQLGQRQQTPSVGNFAYWPHGHISMVSAYDPDKNMVRLIGGNQGGLQGRYRPVSETGWVPINYSGIRYYRGYAKGGKVNMSNHPAVKHLDKILAKEQSRYLSP